MHTPMGEDFENWANEISEDAFETQDEEYAELEKIMSNPLRAGVDGIDARHALIRLFNDESLSSDLLELSQGQGPDADARQVVLNWMKSHGMKIVASRVEQKLAQQTPAQPAPPPTQPAPAPQPVGASKADQSTPAPVSESNSLDFMRRLAGLVK